MATMSDLIENIEAGNAEAVSKELQDIFARQFEDNNKLVKAIKNEE
jgi:hypothetical protein